LPLWQWTTTETNIFFLLLRTNQKSVNSSAGHFLEGAAGCNICHYPQPPVPFLYGDDIYYDKKRKNENIDKQYVKTTFDKRRPDCHYTGLSCEVDNLILIGGN
jgi:hypothetical protein